MVELTERKINTYTAYRTYRAKEKIFIRTKI